MVKELSDLVNYLTPYHFKSFRDSERRRNVCHISSFNEGRAQKLITNFAPEFVDYNIHQLSRIYPKGNRIYSSNFNPQVFWNVGCQAVALNYQTHGVPLEINFGRFYTNQRSGYVLKPALLRDRKKVFNPFSNLVFDHVVALDVTVTVLSAQHVGRADAAPYVELMMVGLPSDTSKRVRTRPSRAKSLAPRWNVDNSFTFNQINLPEMTLLRLAVYDSARRELGWACLPLDCLRPGYHHIPLQDAKSRLAQVFVRIDIKINVPSQHQDFVDNLINPTDKSAIIAVRMKHMKNLTDLDEADQDANKSADGSPAKAAGPEESGGGAATSGSSSALGLPLAGGTTPPAKASIVSGPSPVDQSLRNLDGFHDSVSRVMQEFKTATVAGRQKMEKALLAIDKKHQKEMEACRKRAEQNAKRLIAALEQELKHVHTQHHANVKKAAATFKRTPSDASVVADLNQARRAGHQALVDTEASHVTQYLAARRTHLVELHELALRLADENAAVRLERLDEEHRKSAAALIKILDKQADVAMKDWQKKAKVQGMARSQLDLMREDINSKLVTHSVEKRRELSWQQSMEKETMKKQLAEDRQSLISNHSKAVADLDRAMTEKKLSYSSLRAAPIDTLAWDRDNVKIYLANLRSANRIPASPTAHFP